MTRRVRPLVAKTSGDPTRQVSLTVNGEAVTREVSTRLLLSDFLRHELGLTGTHVGCEHGICGACTIRLDGKPVRACLLLAVQTDGRRIDTVEGLASADGALSVLQDAFHRHFALQCGFCTPGMLMTLQGFLDDNPDPTKDQVRAALSGNICRCTGYSEIVDATLDAAARLRNQDQAATTPT